MLKFTLLIVLFRVYICVLRFDIVDGSPGMDTWNCKYLAPLKKKSSKSLVLLNYPSTQGNNRYGELMKAIHRCHTCASGNWPNFIAVDYAEVHNGLLSIKRVRDNYLKIYLSGKLSRMNIIISSFHCRELMWNQHFKL